MKLENYNQIESTNIDFKEKLETSHPKSWLKSVSAFANTKGGILLYGVDDNRKPVGINNVKETSSKITELINSKILPTPRYEIQSFSENGMDFIEVKVGDGPSTPYYYNSDGRKTAYIRTGDQSIEAPNHILQNLILKGQNKTYDCLPSEYKMDDVSFTLLDATLKRETESSLDIDRDYISLNLVNNAGYITNAGLLLCDQGLIKQSRIFCTRWKGVVKGSIEGDAVDDKEYSGSIISLLENAEIFIKNNSKTSWQIDGMIRKNFEEYPTKAVREALVNAIIHRDYQIIGSEIHIDMYDDRLEITSPGGMLDGSNIQDLDLTKIPSIRRNTIISDIFNRLHLMERRGSGITRIIESYFDFDKKPMFSSGISNFTVVFPNKGYRDNRREIINVSENIVNDNDYFFIKVYKCLAGKVRTNFLDNLQVLFEKYGFDQIFTREELEKVFNVKRSRGSEIVATLVDNKLIEVKTNSKYKFIK